LIFGSSGFRVANLANAISVRGLGTFTAEARLPGGGQALRSPRREIESNLRELGVSVVKSLSR